MATAHSTRVPSLPGKLPFFDLCDASGKYKARRELTTDQIIRAAKAALAQRCCRGASFTAPEAASDYLIVLFPRFTFIHAEKHEPSVSMQPPWA